MGEYKERMHELFIASGTCWFFCRYGNCKWGWNQIHLRFDRYSFSKYYYLKFSQAIWGYNWAYKCNSILLPILSRCKNFMSCLQHTQLCWTFFHFNRSCISPIITHFLIGILHNPQKQHFNVSKHQIYYRMKLFIYFAILWICSSPPL